MKTRFRLLTARDDVALAIDTAPAASIIPASFCPQLLSKDLVLKEDISAGHKLALRDIKKGEAIYKYGFPIGKATQDIAAGSWIHTHNIQSMLDKELEYRYTPQIPEAFEAAASQNDVFYGYPRADGKVGIRNELWIIPTVGCVNGVALRTAKNAEKKLAEAGIQNDGVHAFTHPYGCSQLGEDHENTRTILANLVKHPNAGGVLVLGLGCENNTISEFKKLLGPVDTTRIRFLVVQESDDELEEAVNILYELAILAEKDKKQAHPVSRLIVGMKCGGSDGFSGITANPLVGSFTDRLVKAGGTAILTEVPEMFGAETILMNRAVNKQVFEDTVQLINQFKQYFIRHGQTVYENPSPGNKDGGISTLEDKSLGCVQKGGRAPVSAVYPYGGLIDKKGLVLLSGPGNDIVSVTALAAAGAHLVLFTTGRGNPLGGPIPTVKISSNSMLAQRKKSWIDFDAGALLDCVDSSEQLAVEDAFYELVLKTASGSRTRNEENNYREIAILKDGVTL